MTTREAPPGAVGHRVAEAYRAPAFDEVRAERILVAARGGEAAFRRTPRRARGVRLALALAACASVVLAAVTWPASRWTAPPDSVAAPTPRGSAIALGSVDRLADGRLSWQSARHLRMSSPTGYSTDPGGGEARSDGRVLLLATDVVSQPARMGDLLTVRLTLSNLWGGAIRWERFRFGLSVTTTFQPDPSTPDGIEMGSGRRALVLRPGESTTTVLSTSLPIGTWQVVGSYRGDPGGASGMTRAVTVVVPSRQ